MKSGFPGAGSGWPVGGIFDAMDQLRGMFEQKVAAPRMARGDVRAAVLALLAEQPMHGYQIIQQIDERSGGSWKPSPGSVYPTLQLLADEGAVEVEEQGGRKTYSLTEAGRAEASDRPAPWQGQASATGAATGEAGSHAHGARNGGPGFGALPKAGANLAQAAMQVGRTGTPEQVQQAVDVIDEARRKLYAILAEG
ncbi:MAG TPA: PadR family transcriptional regulator [Microbacteriaceae bacterium]|nr:PadR family transcriptional regulator [Microbacteriaceae bacterium]